jgi:hypothetical protein
MRWHFVSSFFSLLSLPFFLFYRAIEPLVLYLLSYAGRPCPGPSRFTCIKTLPPPGPVHPVVVAGRGRRRRASVPFFFHFYFFQQHVKSIASLPPPAPLYSGSSSRLGEKDRSINVRPPPPGPLDALAHVGGGGGAILFYFFCFARWICLTYSSSPCLLSFSSSLSSVRLTSIPIT